MGTRHLGGDAAFIQEYQAFYRKGVLICWR